MGEGGQKSAFNSFPDASSKQNREATKTQAFQRAPTRALRQPGVGKPSVRGIIGTQTALRRQEVRVTHTGWPLRASRSPPGPYELSLQQGFSSARDHPAQFQGKTTRLEGETAAKTLGKCNQTRLHVVKSTASLLARCLPIFV